MQFSGLLFFIDPLKLVHLQLQLLGYASDRRSKIFGWHTYVHNMQSINKIIRLFENFSEELCLLCNIS